MVRLLHDVAVREPHVILRALIGRLLGALHAGRRLSVAAQFRRGDLAIGELNVSLRAVQGHAEHLLQDMLVFERLFAAHLLVVAELLLIQLFRLKGHALAGVRDIVLLKLLLVDALPRRQLARLRQPHSVEALPHHLVQYHLWDLVADRWVVLRDVLLLFLARSLHDVRDVSQPLVAEHRRAAGRLRSHRAFGPAILARDIGRHHRLPRGPDLLQLVSGNAGILREVTVVALVEMARLLAASLLKYLPLPSLLLPIEVAPHAGSVLVRGHARQAVVLAPVRLDSDSHSGFLPRLSVAIVHSVLAFALCSVTTGVQEVFQLIQMLGMQGFPGRLSREPVRLSSTPAAGLAVRHMDIEGLD